MAVLAEQAVEWELGENPAMDVARAFLGDAHAVLRRVMPAHAGSFGFSGAIDARWCDGGGWLAVRIRDLGVPGMPRAGRMEAEEEEFLEGALGLPVLPEASVAIGVLGEEWFSPSCFTFVGPFVGGRTSYGLFQIFLAEWFARVVAPALRRLNVDRVLEVLPRPPLFDVVRVMGSLWVLYSEGEQVVGTGFSLVDGRVVTCAHVLRGDTVAFRADEVTKSFGVEVVGVNEDVDLAVLRLVGADLGVGLELGGVGCVSVLDHVLVAGFGNYRLGDSGVVSPGVVSGFRPFRGVRRFLVNAPIVGGMSGGPVVDGGSSVVGVAVTGAERMDEVLDTEDHGVIPIEVLSVLE